MDKPVLNNLLGIDLSMVAYCMNLDRFSVP